jgi:hypothetical protein
MEYLGAWGTQIHEKSLKSKISCQTPFKYFIAYLELIVSKFDEMVSILFVYFLK